MSDINPLSECAALACQTSSILLTHWSSLQWRLPGGLCRLGMCEVCVDWGGMMSTGLGLVGCSMAMGEAHVFSSHHTLSGRTSIRTPGSHCAPYGLTQRPGDQAMECHRFHGYV